MSKIKSTLEMVVVSLYIYSLQPSWKNGSKEVSRGLLRSIFLIWRLHMHWGLYFIRINIFSYVHLSLSSKSHSCQWCIIFTYLVLGTYWKLLTCPWLLQEKMIIEDVEPLSHVYFHFLEFKFQHFLRSRPTFLMFPLVDIFFSETNWYLRVGIAKLSLYRNTRLLFHRYNIKSKKRPHMAPTSKEDATYARTCALVFYSLSPKPKQGSRKWAFF